jgi:Beta-ketoacyl synthase, N-terminal domain
MMVPLYVDGFAWFGAPGPDAEHAAPEREKLDLSLLTPSLRRGLSDPTRLFLHVARGAVEQARLPAAALHVVFASAFGEIVAAEKLMAQAFAENSSSPARFRHSVHNTAAGLFSISTRNQLPATAIAAGWDTPAMGLLEASALLAQGGAEHVLLVFVEEAVPEALSAGYGYPAFAAGLVLGPAPSAQTTGRIEHLRREPSPPAGPELPSAWLNHPLAACVSLCRALETRGRATLAVGAGPEPWCVDVDARHPRAAEEPA